MGAPAISTRARPARKPTSTPARLRSATSGNVAMLPVNAVSGLADSGVVMGISRSRVWIVVLGVLLGGIVAMNVVGLSLSAAGSRTAAKIDELQQDNSVLQARIANRLSNERVTEAATALGLAVPAPDAVNYLGSSNSDAGAAADRLADGSVSNAPPTIVPSEADLADPAVESASPIVVADATAVPDPTATTDPTATIATTATTDPTAIP